MLTRLSDLCGAGSISAACVISRLSIMKRNQAGAAEAILENVRTGAFQIPLQLSRAAGPLQGLFRKYRDREMDLADACLVHLAGELQTGDILTLDSDFEIYRWGTGRPFHLLLKNQAG